MMGHYPPHMMWNCCTPVRECHKEFKDLLVAPRAARTLEPSGQQTLEPLQTLDRAATLATGLEVNREPSKGEVVEPIREKPTIARGTAIIGGGCCVHLAVEYMPDPAVDVVADNGRSVTVTVLDSDNSELTWTKEFTKGYHVKENIITTKPGATLTVNTKSAIARVRWCEIYSG